MGSLEIQHEPEENAINLQMNEKTSFQTFIRENYYDAEAFFRSVAAPEGPYYLYLGDLQSNLYYISDNMRDDFGFQENIVQDLIEKWSLRIRDPEDNFLYHQDLQQMFDQKKDIHSLRYRVTDKDGKSAWVHCRGILKWSDDKTVPLFFSGCVSRLESKFSIDFSTGFWRQQAALNSLSALGEKQEMARIIGFGLNHFTYINESRGRVSGDMLLRSIADSLTQELGRQYTFYRLDGIRFMAVSKNGRKFDDPEDVGRIRRIIEKCYTARKLSSKQAASFGVLHFPEDGRLPQEILENTITLINIAKVTPELEYAVFSQDVISKKKDKSKMAIRLSECVDKNFSDFRIVIQPIVSCGAGKVIGGETLLRWKYHGQDISPVIFIPLLEETRLILPVGKWVFEQAVTICKRIIEDQPDFLLSFNVSYLQILDDTFLPFIKQTLEKSGLDGRNLMVELTETHFDEMPMRLKNFVAACQEMGMRFALDDFGNGFSSLQMLFKYPVNVVKLDRTLMNEITHSHENMDFIMSIIYACHRAGKEVCVEGVETDNELLAVRRTDCDMIQGYYFYKPLELAVLLDGII